MDKFRGCFSLVYPGDVLDLAKNREIITEATLNLNPLERKRVLRLEK